MKLYKEFGLSIFLLLIAYVVSFVTTQGTYIATLLDSKVTGTYVALSILLITGVVTIRIAPKTFLPAYVWAIIFGIALQLPLLPLTTQHSLLLFVAELFTAFILFSSGIHIPVRNFKKHFAPIASLSLFGTLLTVFLFALALTLITSLFGYTIPVFALLLLSAILASVDPTSVIPTLEKLHFKRPFIRDIAVAESAVNDIVGVVLTRFFLFAALSTSATLGSLTVSGHFSALFTRAAFNTFSVQIVWGIIVGLLGAWILRVWGETTGKRHWSDSALFFSVPILCFALGSLVDGAGFFAAFIAGMLYEIESGAREVHAFFESLVDRFMKPTIFVLIGALVPLSILANTILLGTILAIVFMFFIRPFIVYISLLPWMIHKDSLIHWEDAMFLSFIRETGAISAVLLVYLAALGILGFEVLFALAVWVILFTLILEPPLTHIMGKQLEVVSEK
jgi:NhaP-type Na+/H+ or K+/H+ antiporter